VGLRAPDAVSRVNSMSTGSTRRPGARRPAAASARAAEPTLDSDLSSLRYERNKNSIPPSSFDTLNFFRDHGSAAMKELYE
jgi:hypothetical protein